MKLNRLIYSIALLAVCGGCSDNLDADYHEYVLSSNPEYPESRLVWAEEFDNDGLAGPETWGYETGYQRNYELQDYKANDMKYSRVENGTLIIEAHPDNHQAGGYDFKYSSASLTTKGKRTFKYGRIDIAAKIPTARGVLPTFRLLPNDENSSWGEIDIMEFAWGRYWGDQYKKNTINAYVQTESSTTDGVAIEPGTGDATSLENAYHLYSLVWLKKKIQILLDNKVIFTYEKKKNDPTVWPFNSDYYLLLSLAVGGTKGGAFGIDEEEYPKRMEIDYIRYYEILNDDEDDLVEDPNLMRNSGFEEAFEEGKEPSQGGYVEAKVADHKYEWFMRNNQAYTIKVDNTEKHSGKNSLSVSGPFTNTWDVDLAYAIDGQPAGKYTFSFWVKSDMLSTSFTTAVTFCENEEDLNWAYQGQKSIVLNDDGTQKVATGNRNPSQAQDVSSTKSYQGIDITDWTKYSITIDLPESILIKFVFKPCTYGTNWHTAVKPASGNAKWWFDDFSFEKVD